MRQQKLRSSLEHPYRHYIDARRRPQWKFGRQVFTVWSYDDVLQVLTSPDFSRDFMPHWIRRRWLHYGVRGSVGRARGSEHNRMRRAAIRVVRPSVFKMMQPVYQELAEGLVDRVSQPGTTFDMVELAQMTFDAACVTFGLDELRTDDMRRRFFAWVDKFGGSSPFYTFAQKEVRETFTRITHRRLLHPEGKPIDTMLDDPAMLLEEKIIMVFFMLMSAVITTTHALCAAAAALLAYNSQQQLSDYKQRVLGGDTELLRRLERETVRLFPPNVSRPFRVVGNNTVLAGQRLPKGKWVSACWRTADCDPDYFPDPLVFNLDRPIDHPILGFSEGSDYACVGQSYSEEIFIAFHTALARIIDRLEVKELTIKGQIALTTRRMIVAVQ